MNENLKKDLIVKTITEVECFSVPNTEKRNEKYSKIPFDQIASMGIAFEPIVSIFQNVTGQAGKEGLYKVTFPPHAKNGTMVKFNDKNAFMGGIKVGDNPEFVGQSELRPLPCDPTMLCMAAVMMSVNKKLDEIKESQEEIIEFLRLKEKASLKGNIAVLQEVFEEYKYNFNNDTFKINKHILVQDIKREAEKSIVFCKEQISKKVDKKSFLHGDSMVKTKIQEVGDQFDDYELATYIFAFAFFMEVMLLENFESRYLDSVAKKIKGYIEEYNALYEDCYKKIEEDSKTSLQAYALKGVSGASKTLGKWLGKIPKLGDNQKLTETGEKVDAFNAQRTENTMLTFARERCAVVRPFLENVIAINKIYNQPMEVMFDKGNLYLDLSA